MNINADHPHNLHHHPHLFEKKNKLVNENGDEGKVITMEKLIN